MLASIQPDQVLLDPLRVISRGETLLPPSYSQNLAVQLGWPGESESFWFFLGAMAQSTPQAFERVTWYVQAASKFGLIPMVLLPYLSPARLEEIRLRGVNGVDLCGNGSVTVPGRLHVYRTGQPNQYPDSRPLNNPYRGRSAMVARMLVSTACWESLKALQAAVVAAGCDLSVPQTSKAIHALVEEEQIAKVGRKIVLRNLMGLLADLQREWSRQPTPVRHALRLPAGTDVAAKLSADPKLRWAVTGESSVSRYTTFTQGGPIRIAVSDWQRAADLLNGSSEAVPNFATVELWQTDEAGYFFANEIDERGMRWACLLQTWLELRAGDARQHEAAADLYARLFKGLEP